MLNTSTLKKHSILLLAALLIFLSCGCSGQGSGGQPAAGSDTEGVPAATAAAGEAGEKLVPVASFSPLNLQVMPADSDDQLLIQENMYYMVHRYDKEKKESSKTVYRQNLLQEEDPEALVTVTGTMWRTICYTADRKGNYYLLVQEEKDSRLYLEKYNQAKELVYRKEYQEGEIPLKNGLGIAGLAASEGGNLCFYSSDGLLVFCDESGAVRSSSRLEVPGLEGIVLGSGEQAAAFSWVGENIELYSMDLARGKLQEGGPCASFPATTTLPQIYSGYEEGVYIGADDGLWQYNPENAEHSLLLAWDESRLNIDGNMVRGISRMENGSFLAVLWDVIGFAGEQVQIAFHEEGTLPERKVITVGVAGYSRGALDEYIRLFNRQSQEWEAELVVYGEAGSFDSKAYAEAVNQLNLALLQGEGPDLFDLNSIAAESMAANGLLEDLEGYFRQSKEVSKEDILEPVWQAGMVNGKMTGIIPSFYIYTLISKNPEQQPGWTVEEALSMSEGEDWDYLLEFMQPVSAFSLVVDENLDYFIDYEEGKCYFEGEEFLSVLEQLNTLEYSKEMTPAYRHWESGEDLYREFLQGNYLLLGVSFSNMQDFLRIKAMCSKSISWVGYPSMDGRPKHQLNASCKVGMNSASGNKEGAWAFLEFLLSEPVQNRRRNEEYFGSFPVKKEAFERFLKDSYYKEGDRMQSQYKPEEEDFQAVRDMVNCAQFSRDSAYHDPIDLILIEESQGFMEGDFTAEETAHKINTRVQLYLDEMRQ